ncbi:MAG TPA: cobalt ECF transporter T component CbiQ [Coleofasciculaceae cyanobacterium]
MLLHIGAFRLDTNSQGTTPWHQLTPRIRVLCALLFVFATALTANGRWWTWLIYGLGLAALILRSRLTLPVLLRRVAVELSFISVVLIGTLFRGSGAVLWQWGWLQITDEGLMILGSVTAKALLCLLMLNLLVLTTSIPALLHALKALRMPSLLIAIIASMYRYIAVILEEVNTMRRAAASRNLMSTPRGQRLVVGNMIGSLFIRTYERGDRIHQAMLARGYTGLPPLAEISPHRKIDIWALIATALLLLLGQAVYLQ